MRKQHVLKPLTGNACLVGDMWKMSFLSQEIAPQIVPGQFVHICIPNHDQPFLRRPFSVANIDPATGLIDIIYRVVGDGTRRLSNLKVGDIIDCMGPLGAGFRICGKEPLLVGGGMGIAPLIPLAKAFKATPIRVLLGAKNKAEMFWPDYFDSTNATIHVTTDDGSLGKKGFVPELLPEVLNKSGIDVIYTCGPEPLMKIVAKEAKQRGISCQVSLEAHMGCGVGACLSCTCQATDGTRRKICTDGPVFDALEVFS